jgi:hypothetical protein
MDYADISDSASSALRNSEDRFDAICVIGDDITFLGDKYNRHNTLGYAERNIQAFGEGTTQIMQGLTVGVIGCSGTGSIVAEQLTRLGVGRLILVDPDVVEEKNLNRVINATTSDVGSYKTDVQANAIMRTGLNVDVVSIHVDLLTREAVRAVSACDVVFGCMDGVEGRHILNRIAVFYLIPYFDVGVRLDADGAGGIDNICGQVNYLIPDGSSLLSRGCITQADLEAEGLKKSDPEEYSRRRTEKYIKGVDEDRPAVIAPNMMYASMVVNEFLARVHPYRYDHNDRLRSYSFSLAQNQFYNFSDSNSDRIQQPCQALARYVGRGDMRPLLDMPVLS